MHSGYPTHGEEVRDQIIKELREEIGDLREQLGLPREKPGFAQMIREGLYRGL